MKPSIRQHRLWLALLAAIGALAIVAWGLSAMKRDSLTLTASNGGAVDFVDLNILLPDTQFQLFEFETATDVCLRLSYVADIDGEKRGEFDGDAGSFGHYYRCVEAGKHRLMPVLVRQEDRWSLRIGTRNEAGTAHGASGYSIGRTPGKESGISTYVPRQIDLSSGETTLMSWIATEKTGETESSIEFLIRVERFAERDDSLGIGPRVVNGPRIDWPQRGSPPLDSTEPGVD